MAPLLHLMQVETAGQMQVHGSSPETLDHRVYPHKHISGLSLPRTHYILLARTSLVAKPSSSWAGVSLLSQSREEG